MHRPLSPIVTFGCSSLSLLVTLASQAPTVAPAPPAAPLPPLVPPAALQTITAQELMAHAQFLASDELQGRLTGSPGQQAAASYIAKHFEQLGLAPLGDEVDGKRTWFQHYAIERTYVKPSTRLQLGQLALVDGFAVLGGRPIDVECVGTLQFCGLGRTSGPKADLAEDASLADKIAVVAFRAPRGKLPRPLPIERKFMNSLGVLNQMGKTVKELAKRNAAAVVFVQLDDPTGLVDVLNYVGLAPGKDALTAAFVDEPGLDQTLKMFDAGDGPPTFLLSIPASRQLLAELGIGVEAVAALLGAGDAVPTAKADVAAKVVLNIGRDPTARASNVVAVLRGRDPALAAEAVVYSAHMDHVGTRIDGEVFNGADDNASGSAGLLAIATAFAKSAEQPKRSILFLSVSGEELGLWGSLYFANNPTWPARQMVANINTDMIGRSGSESGPTEVTVTPSHRHAKFSSLVRDAARFGAELGCSFTSGDKYYTRSDHYNFAKIGIPVVFFRNGEHEDYHQVTDHADKLDGAKMERIARLAFWTGWSVANDGERPRQLGKQPAWR
jgi:hypothetical protein